jgi:hypothetical protein
MTTPFRSRFPRGRRVLIGGAIAALALGGGAIAAGTAAGAAPTPPSPSAPPPADTVGPTDNGGVAEAPGGAEPVEATDTDNIQEGDQTGPDTPGADTTAGPAN